MLVADTMFEGVLDKADKHQRRNRPVRHLRRQIDAYCYLVSIAQSHQVDISSDKLHLP